MPATSSKIAVVTVNWNRAELTKQCLQALRASRSVSWHLFVVDNGSTDDSLSALSDLGEDVTLIESGINSGWAGGNNKGIKFARNHGFKWFFLLNNDAIVEPKTLETLIRYVEAQSGESLPIVGAVQLDTDEAFCFYGARNQLNSVFPINLSSSEFQTLGDVYETSFVKGAALLAHTKHFDSIGMFDERFFLNYEETDWCQRAKVAGFPVVMNKSAIVHHSGSGSMGGLTSPISTYFLVRNSLLYAEMHGGIKGVLEALRIKLGWARGHFGTNSSLRAITRTLRADAGWAIAWNLGIRDYALRRFGDCPLKIRELTYARST